MKEISLSTFNGESFTVRGAAGYYRILKVDAAALAAKSHATQIFANCACICIIPPIWIEASTAANYFQTIAAIRVEA